MPPAPHQSARRRRASPPRDAFAPSPLADCERVRLEDFERRPSELDLERPALDEPEDGRLLEAARDGASSASSSSPTGSAWSGSSVSSPKYSSSSTASPSEM